MEVNQNSKLAGRKTKNELKGTKILRRAEELQSCIIVLWVDSSDTLNIKYFISLLFKNID